MYGLKHHRAGYIDDRELDRKTLWLDKHSGRPSLMDKEAPYQPEVDGWRVVHVKIGTYCLLIELWNTVKINCRCTYNTPAKL